MLKIKKTWQNNQARDNYPGIFSNPGNRENFFPEKLKIREKGKP